MLEIKPGLFLSERGPVVFLKVPAWDGTGTVASGPECTLKGGATHPLPGVNSG